MSVSSGFDASAILSDFLAAELDGRATSRWVLVYRVDSAPATRESPTLKAALGGEVRWFDAGFMVTGQKMLALIAGDDIFSGFDAAAVLTEAPNEFAELGAVLTSDRPPSVDDVSRVATWLVDHHGVSAAGDGDGVHWVRVHGL